MKNTQFGRATQQFSSGSPVTASLVVLSGVTFLLSWFGAHSFFDDWMSMDSVLVWSRPWTLLTYPFADLSRGSGFIWTLLTLFIFWQYGQMVERDLKRDAYLVFLASLTVTAGLLCVLMAAATRTPFGLWGLSLLVAGVIIAWAARNPMAQIRIFMIIPVEARWVALISGLAVLFGYGVGAPWMGLAAAAPMGLIWFWGLGRIPWLPYAPIKKSFASKKENQEFTQFIDAVRSREREREEKERLRKLFEDSLKDDPPGR